MPNEGRCSRCEFTGLDYDLRALAHSSRELSAVGVTMSPETAARYGTPAWASLNLCHHCVGALGFFLGIRKAD